MQILSLPIVNIMKIPLQLDLKNLIILALVNYFLLIHKFNKYLISPWLEKYKAMVLNWGQYLVMFEDGFWWLPPLGWCCYWHSVGPKHSKIHRTAPTTKSYLAHNISSVKVEKNQWKGMINKSIMRRQRSNSQPD